MITQKYDSKQLTNLKTNHLNTTLYAKHVNLNHISFHNPCPSDNMTAFFFLRIYTYLNCYHALSTSSSPVAAIAFPIQAAQIPFRWKTCQLFSTNLSRHVRKNPSPTHNLPRGSLSFFSHLTIVYHGIMEGRQRFFLAWDFSAHDIGVNVICAPRCLWDSGKRIRVGFLTFFRNTDTCNRMCCTWN